MVESDAGWSSLAARRAHNPKVTGSNPVPATKDLKCALIPLIINMKCFKFMIDEAEKLCIMRTSLTQSGSEKLKRKHIFDTAL